MAGLHFDITGDNSNFLRKLDEARNGVRTTSKQIEESGMSIESMFGRMAKGALAFGAGISAKEIVSNVMQIRGQFQQLEVAFNTMLGSEQKANDLMQQLIKTAATTPFDLQSVAGGAKQLLAYGTSAEDVNGTLVQLGDIAAGLSIPLNDLVWLYGTTMTQGRLFTNDFRQFQSRGIPLADELAKQFGVTKDKVGELVTAGKVGFPEVQKAIVAMTSDGGKFGGLMEAQSKTITGQISNIEDSIATMYNNIGKSSEGFINDALSGASYLIENYEAIGKTILELAATYGAYKAVLMSVAAYQSFAVGVTYTAEIAELSKLIPLKQQSANEDVIAAVASGKLTQSKAAQVIALRAEISAKIQSLQATEAQTKAEYASAMASYKNATQRMLLAKQNMAIAQSQMSIAIKSGTADEIAAAKKNAQTVSQELNNAAVAKNTTHKSLNTAATNRKSASEALNTLETGKNSVAQVVNTTSTNVLTAAKTKLAAASKALGLSMLTNPYVLIAAAIAGVAFAAYKAATAETELDKATKRLNEANSEVEKSLASEISKLTSLERKLSETKKGTEEYNSVKKTIVDNYGQYYEGLDGEIERVANLSTVYGQLVEAMRLSIGQRKFESFFKAEQDTLDKTIGEKLDTAYNTLIEKYGKTKGSNLYNQFFESSMRGTALAPSVIKDLQDATFMDVKWGSNAKDGIIDFRNSVFDLRSEISKETKATEKALDDYKSKFQMTEEEVAKILSGGKNAGNDDPVENKSLKQLLIDINSAENKLKSLQNQSKQGVISVDKVKEQTDALSKLTSQYRLMTGKEYGSVKEDDKTIKTQQEQSDLLLEISRNAKEREKAERQVAFEIEQAKIDVMKDGFIKEQAQIELNHRKALQGITLRGEEMLKAQQEAERKQWEKDGKKGVFTPETTSVSQLPAEQLQQLADLMNGVVAGTESQNQSLIDKLLNQYQGYAEKRKEIKKKFDDDIRSMQEKNTDGKYDANIKEAERKSKEELESLDMEFAQRNDEFNAWAAGIVDSSVAKLTDLLSQANEALENTKPEGDKGSEQLAILRAKIQTLQKQLRTQTIKETKDNSDPTLKWKKTTKALKDVKSATDDIVDSFSNLDEGTKEILTSVSVVAGATIEAIGGLTSLVDNAGNAMSLSAFMASKSISMVEKASVILTVISLAMKAAMAIANLFKSSAERERERQEKLIQGQLALNQAIAEEAVARVKAKSNKTVFFDDYQNDIDVAIEGIISSKGEYQDALDMLAKTTIKHSKSGWFSHGSIFWKDTWYEPFMKDYPNLIKADGELDEAEAKRILSVGDLSDAQKDLINEMLDSKKAMQEYEETINGVISDLSGSIGNDLKDAWVEAFRAQEDASAAARKAIEGDLEAMIESMLFSITIQERLMNLQNSMKAHAKSGLSGTELTKAWFGDIATFFDNLPAAQKQFFDGLQMFQNEANERGFDLWKKEEGKDTTDSENSLKGAYAKASEESVGLLAGQTGAMRVVMEDIKNNMQPIREQMQFIYNLQKEGWQDVKAIRDLTTKIDKNTEQVAENTAKIHEVAGAVAKNTKSTVEALEGTLNVNIKGM